MEGLSALHALERSAKKFPPMINGFFQYGEHNTDLHDSSYEDFLVADRPGLIYLRSKIDEVLAGQDEVKFLDDSFPTDLNGIRVATRTFEKQADSKWDSLGPAGCIIAAVAILSILGLGFWKLVELLFQ